MIQAIAFTLWSTFAQPVEVAAAPVESIICKTGDSRCRNVGKSIQKDSLI